MHSRHRSPGGGGGVRSNSVGIGGLAASRTSPDTNLPRNFGYSRSFGGRVPPSSKPYLSSQPLPLPPPPRKADILMEAGRLATEYLVSQGVLPPTVLPQKWSNGGSSSKNNQIMDFQMSPDGRPSALARLGNGYSDSGSRNRFRGRRRMGSARDYDSEWGGRDNRKGFFPDRAQNYGDDREYDDDFVMGQRPREEQQIDSDVSGGGFSKSLTNETPPESDTAGNSEPMFYNSEVHDDVGLKVNNSTAGKELNTEKDCEASNASDEMTTLNMGIGKVNVCTTNDDPEKQSVLEELSMSHLPIDGDIISKNDNDLLRLCDFAKVPTRARSSLAIIKDSKVDNLPMEMEESARAISPQEEPKVSKGEDPSESLSNSMVSNQPQNSKCLDSNVSGAQSIQMVEDARIFGSSLAAEKSDSIPSQSLLDRSAIYEQASGQGLSEFEGCNPVVKDRGEKRSSENDDLREGSKKPRECPTIAVCTDDYFQLHSFNASSSHLAKSSVSEVQVVDADDQEGLFNISVLPRGELDSGIESREKQLFPNSFKICDLNLMESSDMTENRDGNPIYGLSSTMEAKKGVQVDVDLSMSNNFSKLDDYERNATDAKEAIIVEVEDDSAKEEEDVDTSERKTEIARSSLESYPNNMDNSVDLPDAQDGYGLMISELLGNDISNCSSVPTDITTLHNGMGLHNGVEILDDDDPIYLSLGEIPISFLGGWEQPPQPFEKPF